MSEIYNNVTAIHLGARAVFRRGGSSGITLPAVYFRDCKVVDAYFENGMIVIKKRKINNDDALLMSVSVWLCFFVFFAQFAAVLVAI